MSPQNSSPFPSCFRPSSAAATADFPLPPPSPAPTSRNPNLTTCLYQTEIGIFSLTWSRTFLGNSLSLNLYPIDSTGNTYSPVSLSNRLSLPSISFNLHLKPFLFWKKHGSKKLQVLQETSSMKPPRVQIFWDLSRAKFGSGPEPQSGFYLSVLVDHEMVLLVGDLSKEACRKIKAKKPERTQQVLLLRREHVFGNRVYSTKARFGGKNREITIDCSVNNDAKLCFSVDRKRVLQIKRLKWKFRGNERIEVDGVNIQVSWDVYNWLFEDNKNEHAVFMFKFEDDKETNIDDNHDLEGCDQENKNGVDLWQEQQENTSGGGIGEWRKMRKSLMRTARSSSSSSISTSSASSGCSSSVMEWASVEESELSTPNGFSLLVYAWKK